MGTGGKSVKRSMVSRGRACESGETDTCIVSMHEYGTIDRVGSMSTKD